MLIYGFGNPPAAKAPKGIDEHLFEAFLRRDSLAGTGFRQVEGLERAQAATREHAGKDRVFFFDAGWAYWR